MSPIEPVTMRNCKAAQIAADNGCPFCIARVSTFPKDGQQALIVNGVNSGRVVRLVGAGSFFGWRGRVDVLANEPREEIVGYEHDFLAAIPFMPVDWLSHLSIRDSFIVDQLAVEFCERGLSAGNFVWNTERAVKFASEIWAQRIPITIEEAVSCVAAHGLPSLFHDRFAELYKVSLMALKAACGRSAIKKRRFTSFANRDADLKAWTQTYICPTN